MQIACREFFLFTLQISALVFLRSVGTSWEAWCDCVTSLGPILLVYISIYTYGASAIDELYSCATDKL